MCLAQDVKAVSEHGTFNSWHKEFTVTLSVEICLKDHELLTFRRQKKSFGNNTTEVDCIPLLVVNSMPRSCISFFTKLFTKCININGTRRFIFN